MNGSKCLVSRLCYLCVRDSKVCSFDCIWKSQVRCIFCLSWMIIRCSFRWYCCIVMFVLCWKLFCLCCVFSWWKVVFSWDKVVLVVKVLLDSSSFCCNNSFFVFNIWMCLVLKMIQCQWCWFCFRLLCVVMVQWIFLFNVRGSMIICVFFMFCCGQDMG